MNPIVSVFMDRSIIGIGPLHPEFDQRAQSGQLFTLDSSLALKERMENVVNENCDETTTRKLGDIMKNISRFAAAAFNMMHEVEKGEIARTKKE